MLLAAFAGSVSPAELVKIGALTEGWGPTPGIVGLRDGLTALGYREGEQFVIGVRFTRGDVKALPQAMRDLMSSGSTIIFANGLNAAKVAKAATTTLPVVFAVEMPDPVQIGLVRTYSHPGGNLTGISDLSQELGPKRLEILKEILPGLKRVAFPYDPDDEPSVEALRLSREAARQLGMTLLERPLRTEQEARKIFATLRKSDADAVIIPGQLSLNIPGFILDMTSQHGLPTMFSGAFWVERGGLVSYGADFHESGRLAARLVDRIIKGEKPAAIAVESNPRIELVINLKVAKALGLSLSPTLLQRATRVIE
ncbi:MAG TPA: ABC transporter substrate-binding protein [Casimicrobiaceae bacterium]|nr:ABC transporter substrate-binding protein [Casimicrobiaceae bacterium]